MNTVKPQYRVNLPALVECDVRTALVARDVRPVCLHVVGEPGEVRAVVRNANTRGTLVEYSIPRRLKDGRIAVDVTVMQPFQPAQSTKTPLVTRARVAIVGGVLVAVGAVTYGAVLLVDWILSNVPLVVAGLAAIVILPAVAVAVKTGCQGAHCGGCDS